MKKLLTIVALASVVSLSYGQGYVSFINSTGTRVSTYTQVYGHTGGTSSLVPAYTSGSFYYALFVAPSTTTTIGVSPVGDPTRAGWTFTGDYGTNTVAGRVQGVSAAADGFGISIPGYAIGATANFAVVGWSASLGSTWAAVQSQIDSYFTEGYYGVDQTIATNVVLSPYQGPYWSVMGSGAAGGFLLYPQGPEPSTISLVGLGAAALVVFHRRK
jgi:PEP-CTERM motif